MIFQERVLSRRRSEYDRLREEREERINQIIQSRNQEREAKRKMIYFLRAEEERQKRLREEEEARKIEGTFPFEFLMKNFIPFWGKIKCLFRHQSATDVLGTCACSSSSRPPSEAEFVIRLVIIPYLLSQNMFLI